MLSKVVKWHTYKTLQDVQDTLSQLSFESSNYLAFLITLGKSLAELYYQYTTLTVSLIQSSKVKRLPT